MVLEGRDPEREVYLPAEVNPRADDVPVEEDSGGKVEDVEPVEERKVERGLDPVEEGKEDEESTVQE